MYKKTFMVGFAGLASAGSWSGSSGMGGSMPSCWSSCFASNGVTSEAACCGNDALSKCVHDTCSSADDQSYWSWYDGYCGSESTTSSTISATTPVQYTTPTSPISTTTTAVETSPIETTPTTTIPTSPAEYSPTTSTCTETTSPAIYRPTASTSTSTTSPASPSSTPTCWTECFQENNIQSEAALCGNTAVDSCIQQKCSSADDQSYWTWYGEFCSSTTSSTQSTPTTTPVSPTSPTYPVTTPSTTLQTTTTPASPTSPTTTSPPTSTPSCWTECFQENNITSESELCGNTAVDSCIQQKCSAADDQAYWSWYLEYCPAPTSPTSSTVIPTSPVSSPTGGSSTTTTTTSPAGSPTADCWSACFAKYNVQSEASLCSNDQVSACIHDTCSAELDKAYWVWYAGFCSPSSSTSVITTTSTSTPAGATTPSTYTTTYVSTITIPSTPKVTPTNGLPTPYETSPVGSTPAAPGSSSPSSPAAPGSGAPGYGGAQPPAPGSPSSYPVGPVGASPSGYYPSGTAAASGSWPGASYSPVAATGDAFATKPGMFFAAAMVLIALF